MFHDLTDSSSAKDNNLHVHAFTVATKPGINHVTLSLWTSVLSLSDKQLLKSTLHSVNQRTDNR